MIDLGYKVRLGPLRHENLWKYYEARNDYRVWKWCRQFDLLTEDRHESWMLSVQNSSDTRMYEILAKTDDKKLQESFQPVGVCGLTSIDHVNQRAEFSLYIFPEYHNQGYGSDGLRTLFTHGFLSLNLNRIWGETFQDNPAITMFENLGMEREGTRKAFYFREGHFIDAHLYAIGREQWLKQS